MVISDLNIICIGQTHYALPPQYLCGESLTVEFEPRWGDLYAVYPDYSFPEAYALEGYWYTLWPSVDGSSFLDNPFFDIALQDEYGAVITNPHWRPTLQRIMQFYLSQSPQHKIGVLIRIQDNIYKGAQYVRTLQELWNLMDTHSIRFNKLYVVIN